MSEEQVQTPATKAETIITMTDGRQVNFNSRNKLIKENSRNPEVVRDEVYTDPDTGEEVAPLRINCKNGEFFIADVRAPAGTDHFLMQLARHGKSQKISDSVTKPDTDEDLVSGVERTIKQLDAKIWTQMSGDGNAGLGDLLEACRRVKNITNVC